MRTRSMLATSLQAPFSGTDEWAADIRKKLYLGMSANKPPVSNATTQVGHLPQFVFNVLFDLFESGILEEALRHYRAHCQKQQILFKDVDEYITSIRKKLPRSIYEGPVEESS